MPPNNQDSSLSSPPRAITPMWPFALPSPDAINSGTVYKLPGAQSTSSINRRTA